MQNNNDNLKNALESFLENLNKSSIGDDEKEQGVGVVTETIEELSHDSPKKWRIKTTIDYLKNLIVMAGLSNDLVIEGNQLIETLSISIQ